MRIVFQLFLMDILINLQINVCVVYPKIMQPLFLTKYTNQHNKQCKWRTLTI